METTRSLFPLEPSGWPSFPRRPSAASGAGQRGEELFDREVDRSDERAGGRKAVEERNNQVHADRRSERADGFERHREATEADRRRVRHGRNPAETPQHAAHEHPPSERPLPPNAGPPPSGGGNVPPHTGGPTQGDPGGGILDSGGVHARLPGVPPPPIGHAGHVSSGQGHAGGAPLGGTPGGPGGPGGPVTPPAADGHIAGNGALRRGSARADGPGHSNGPNHAAHDPATERANDVLRQIRLHLSPGMRHATLSLVPAELGRVHVHLQLREGKLGAEMRVESAETKELLERHVPELRASLARQGVEVESFEFRLGFDGSDGQADARSEGQPNAPRPFIAPNDDPGLPLRGLPPGTTEHLGGIDTYA